VKTEQFDYELPAASIAQFPPEAREASRLLVLSPDGTQRDAVFTELPALLPAESLLVVNNTRVRRARLQLPVSAGKGELLVLRPLPDGCWLVMGKPGKKLRPGKTLTWADGFSCRIEEVVADGTRRVRFSGEVEPYLEANGEVPLPPYITRPADVADRERYQTVYAGPPGAVAAPTAGLHFTKPLLQRLAFAGIEVRQLTLHVGPGTFRPIRTDEVEEHQLDAEYYEVPTETADAVNKARAEKRPVIAVGTTVVRTLESAVGPAGVAAGTGWSELFIGPDHDFQVVDGLITNFHLPRSPLLVLVAALLGRERLLASYQYALNSGYRFYSYGDAMLILP